MRVAVIYDAASLAAASKKADGTLPDYFALRAEVNQGRAVIREMVFASARTPSNLNSFVHALRSADLEARVLEHKGREPTELRMAIATDAVQLAIRVDRIVLVTADRTFEYLLRRLRELGVTTELWTPNGVGLQKLKAAAGQIREIPAECYRPDPQGASNA